MSFKQYYTFEAFKKSVEWRQERENEEVDRSQLELIQKAWDEAIINFLVEKGKRGELGAVEHSEGHVTRFVEAWKFLQKGEIPEYTYAIHNNFYKLIPCGLNDELRRGIERPMKEWTEEDLKRGYDNLIHQMNQGDFSSFLMGEDVHQCYECGQKMALGFKGWNGRYMMIHYDWSKGIRNATKTVEKPKECLSKNNVSLEVKFESGEVYCADWFRMDAFTKEVEDTSEDRYSNAKSINFKPGRLYAIERLARNHNVVSVNVGNSCPQVCVREGSIAIGWLDEDQEDQHYAGFERGAAICTDLWNATLVDKKQLIAIVEKRHGKDAVQIVEEYLKDNNVPMIKVPPGIYRLSFNPSYEDFEGAFNNEEEMLYPSNCEKFFTINHVEELKARKRNRWAVACCSGDLESAERLLLKSNTHKDLTQEDVNRGLAWASERGHGELVKFLTTDERLKAEGMLADIRSGARSAFLIACETNNVDLVKYLVKSEALLQAGQLLINPQDEPIALKQAIDWGSWDVLEWVILEGSEGNHEGWAEKLKEWEGVNPRLCGLIQACKEKEVLGQMVDQNEDVKIKMANRI